MNSRFFRYCLALAMLVAGGLAGVHGEPSRADLSQRQTEVGNKQFEAKKLDMRVREGFMQRRFSADRWHAEYNSIGRRIAPIQVTETREKQIIRPDVQAPQRVEWGMARQNQQMAYLRNFDRVQEKRMAPRFADAEVGEVRRQNADIEVEERDFAMRDINRYAFQRNHSDEEGLRTIRAGEGDAENSGRSGSERRNSDAR